uniref:NCK interacting protein with SH3 domain n=1 Tax=Eptatretus burgeri TaxID=7764 RepID=A0A8C4R313_EPTBU
MYRALYDFKSAEPNSLRFKAGERFVVLERSNQHWWLASHGGAVGYVPALYLHKDEADLDSVVLSIDRAIETIHNLAMENGGKYTLEQREVLQKLIRHRKETLGRQSMDRPARQQYTDSTSTTNRPRDGQRRKEKADDLRQSSIEQDYQVPAQPCCTSPIAPMPPEKMHSVSNAIDTNSNATKHEKESSSLSRVTALPPPPPPSPSTSSISSTSSTPSVTVAEHSVYNSTSVRLPSSMPHNSQQDSRRASLTRVSLEGKDCVPLPSKVGDEQMTGDTKPGGNVVVSSMPSAPPLCRDSGISNKSTELKGQVGAGPKGEAEESQNYPAGVQNFKELVDTLLSPRKTRNTVCYVSQDDWICRAASSDLPRNSNPSSSSSSHRDTTTKPEINHNMCTSPGSQHGQENSMLLCHNLESSAQNTSMPDCNQSTFSASVSDFVTVNPVGLHCDGSAAEPDTELMCDQGCKLQERSRGEGSPCSRCLFADFPFARTDSPSRCLGSPVKVQNLRGSLPVLPMRPARASLAKLRMAYSSGSFSPTKHRSPSFSPPTCKVESRLKHSADGTTSSNSSSCTSSPAKLPGTSSGSDRLSDHESPTLRPEYTLTRNHNDDDSDCNDTLTEWPRRRSVALSPMSCHAAEDCSCQPASLCEELVEIVRNATGLSYELSRVAVAVMAGHLRDSLPSVAPAMGQLLLSLLTPVDLESEVPRGLPSRDAQRLDEIFLDLARHKDDAQQRSWALHEDEAVILGYLEELLSILTDANPDICRKMCKRDDCDPVHSLIAYYQMEHRISLRLLLLKVFGAMCHLDGAVISGLLNSVLPMELARDIQADTKELQKLCYSVLLLTMVFSMGEPLPYHHYGMVMSRPNRFPCYQALHVCMTSFKSLTISCICIPSNVFGI